MQGGEGKKQGETNREEIHPSTEEEDTCISLEDAFKIVTSSTESTSTRLPTAGMDDTVFTEAWAVETVAELPPLVGRGIRIDTTTMNSSSALVSSQPGAYATVGPVFFATNNTGRRGDGQITTERTRSNNRRSRLTRLEDTASVPAAAAAAEHEATDMATASLVEEEPRLNLPVAQSVMEQPKRPGTSPSRTLRVLFVLLGILLLVVAAAITAAVVSSLPADTTKSTEEARILAVTHRIRQALQKEPLDAVFSNHQARALEWIVSQDALQLEANASDLVSRYALALLYYTTTEQGPWNYCNPSQTTDLCYYTSFLGNGVWDYHYAYWESDQQETTGLRWLSGHSSVCQWAGVYCRATTDRNNNNSSRSIMESQNTTTVVEHIQLDAFHLTGTVPADALSLLSNLRSLSLKSNGLYGILPALLSTGQLVHLNLAENDLTIPSTFWDISSNSISKENPLQMLDLSFNRLEEGYGALDSFHIGLSLPNLTYLNLQGCGVTGTLPNDLYELTRLEHLLLGSNDAMSGTVSTEVGRLSHLNFLDLSSTEISGTLPTEIGLLTHLLELSLWRTHLSGTIPDEIFSETMTYLNAIILSHCHFTGTISSHVSSLPGLGYLLLGNNAGLRGSLPTEMAQLSTLKRLDIQGTGLVGSIPEALCAQRGGIFLSVVKADCEPLLNGSIPMVCPEGCCSRCCNQETGVCADTGY